MASRPPSGDRGGVVLRLLLAATIVLGILAAAGLPAAQRLWRDGATLTERTAEAVRDRLDGLPVLPGLDPPDNDAPQTSGPVPTGVRTAANSVVRVATAGCGRYGAGSGFVYAEDHVMTNAHVVRGASRVQVQAGGRRWSGDVVLFDAGTDVAVLHVPGLPLAPLTFAPGVPDGTAATVAGHPRGGPLTLTGAQVLDTRGFSGWSRDRESYVVRADVQPGNSGGPLLDARGRVLGVVYASAADRTDVGYAVTADAVEDEAAQGAGATAEVSTGGCGTR